MKTCKHCCLELPLTEFYLMANQHYRSNCQSCEKIKQKKWRLANKDKIRGYNSKHNNANNTSIEAGVYAIYQGDEVIYVGQSSQPYRRKSEHFSTYKNLKMAYNNSVIGGAILLGNLNRDDLSFKILEYVGDEALRLEREAYYISIYDPKYNKNLCK